MVRAQKSFRVAVNCFIDETAKLFYLRWGTGWRSAHTSFKGSVTQCRSSQRLSWKGSRGSMIPLFNS